MVKPWQSIDEQLILLKDRDMIISDDNKVKYYLSTVGYTRLMGYAYPLRELKPYDQRQGYSCRKDVFEEGANFETVVQLYKFDNRLKELCFRIIKKIELKLRFALVDTLGKEDPCFYFNSSSPCYKQTVNSQKKITSMIEKFGQMRKKSHDELILHYENRKLPIWIAVEIMDFGMLYHLYSHLDKQKLRKVMSDLKIELNDGHFLSSLQAFNLLRNKCAHHAQCFNKTIKKGYQSPFKQGGSHTEGKIYTLLHALLNFQKVFFNDEELRNAVIERLQNFPQSTLINIGSIGAGKNWREELKEL